MYNESVINTEFKFERYVGSLPFSHCQLHYYACCLSLCLEFYCNEYFIIIIEAIFFKEGYALQYLNSIKFKLSDYVIACKPCQITKPKDDLSVSDITLKKILH